MIFKASSLSFLSCCDFSCSLIVDQWVSLGASNPSGNIDLRSAYYYDVRVDYKYQSGCTSGACTANARLQWFPNGGEEYI